MNTVKQKVTQERNSGVASPHAPGCEVPCTVQRSLERSRTCAFKFLGKYLDPFPSVAVMKALGARLHSYLSVIQICYRLFCAKGNELENAAIYKSSVFVDVKWDANEIQKCVLSECSIRAIHNTFAKFIGII